MVKDWTPERQLQLQQLQSILRKMEVINRTTCAITDIQTVSKLSSELLYDYYNSDGCTFWSFLIQELNKE